MRKCNPLFFLIAVMLCMTVFLLPAYAQASDGEAVKPEASAGTGDVDLDTVLDSFGDLLSAFTPKGNLSLVDDFELKGNDEEGKELSKQFITVESKGGNTFYIIIDRNGDEENVYLLNMVDEADLMALIEPEKEEEQPVCTCKDKCAPGQVDTTCPVCVINLTECTGTEPEPQEETEKEEEQPVKKNGTAAGAAVILVLALAGGAAFYFLKVKGSGKPDTKGDTDLDDYDYGEDEDEMEFESYEEASGESANGEVENDAPPDPSQ